MRKIAKITMAVGVASVLFTGCFGGNGIDEDQLALLTAGKSFEQIKKAYQMSYVSENKKDRKIYEYWLEKNGQKANSAFNAKLFEKKTKLEYDQFVKKVNEDMQKLKEAVDKEIDKIKIGRKLNYNIIRKISNSSRTAAFYMNYAYIKDTYIPFLKKQRKRLEGAEEQRKKNFKYKY